MLYNVRITRLFLFLYNSCLNIKIERTTSSTCRNNVTLTPRENRNEQLDRILRFIFLVYLENVSRTSFVRVYGANIT